MSLMRRLVGWFRARPADGPEWGNLPERWADPALSPHAQEVCHQSAEKGREAGPLLPQFVVARLKRALDSVDACRKSGAQAELARARRHLALLVSEVTNYDLEVYSPENFLEAFARGATEHLRSVEQKIGLSTPIASLLDTK
jgi:hypothetical protein